MSDFYLTLPSNVYGANNITSNYQTELPQTLDLPGQWEVALTEILYPYSWYNVGFNSPDDGKIVVQLDSHIEVVEIPLKEYPTITNLVKTINMCMKSRGEKMEAWEAYKGYSDQSVIHTFLYMTEEDFKTDRIFNTVQQSTDEDYMQRRVNPLDKSLLFTFDAESQRVSLKVKDLPGLQIKVVLSPL